MNCTGSKQNSERRGKYMGNVKKRDLLLVLTVGGFIFYGALQMANLVIADKAFTSLDSYLLYSSLMSLLMGLALILFQQKNIVYNFILLYPYCIYSAEKISFRHFDITLLQFLVILCLIIISHGGAYICVFNRKAEKLRIICRILWPVALLMQMSVFILSVIHQHDFWLPASLINTAYIFTALVTASGTIPFLKWKHPTFTYVLSVASTVLMIIAAIYAYSIRSNEDVIIITVMCYIPSLVSALTILLYGIWLHSDRNTRHVRLSILASVALITSLIAIVFALSYFMIEDYYDTKSYAENEYSKQQDPDIEIQLTLDK